MPLTFSLHVRLCLTAITLIAAAPAIAAEEKPTRQANRLASETSPYLRLHAHNPVEWFPWGPEALEKAKAENKPIFLSIGYSSCFWCHVMERQVFENEQIAAYMNEHFVNIKVDREERPDLDDVYMLALQIYLQATGSKQGGGWPLSIFLTPDGKPIAGGTYFPPEDLPGRPGFPSVLKQVHGLWTTKEDQIRETSEILAKEVRRLSGPQLTDAADAIPTGLARAAVAALKESYDPEYGGFDFQAKSPEGPKFPQPSKLLFLEWIAAADPQNDVVAMLDETLTRMARGGIYDHLGGGFHRYSVDREWVVPHFEKMLYDNAQLAEVYARAAKRTGRSDFRQVALETLAFVMRDLGDPQGAFYSALDAETNGVEGAYYVWSENEVRTTLGDDGFKVFAAAYGMDRPSPFEHGYVLRRVATTEELVKTFGGTAEELDSRLATQRQQLHELRSKRPALLRDEKILAGWNGLMIRALANAATHLDEPRFNTVAERTSLFILTNLRTPEGLAQRSFCEGRASHRACLDDYAYLIDGLVALHQSTGDDRWMNAARRLLDEQIENFWDVDRGGFFYTSNDHEPLLARLKDGYDSVMPSSNGVSATVLVSLMKTPGPDRYGEHANKTLLAFANSMEQSPAGYVRMVQAAEDYQKLTGGEAAKPAAGTELAAGPPVKKPAAARPADQRERVKLQPAAEATAEEAAKHKQITAKLFLSTDRLTPGSTCRVAVVAEIAEGWHINANPAKPDYVVPVELELTSDSGVELTDVVYPPGKDLQLESFDEPTSTLEGRIILYGTLKVPPKLNVKQEELKFSMRYQACNHKECLLQKRYRLNAVTPVASKGQPAKAINASLFPATPAQR